MSGVGINLDTVTILFKMNVTIFTVLDTVHHTSVRVPGAVHVTVRAVVSLRAKEPGCQRHTKIHDNFIQSSFLVKNEMSFNRVYRQFQVINTNETKINKQTKTGKKKQKKNNQQFIIILGCCHTC